MLNTISIKAKLLIPMFILTIILLFLGGMVIAYSYSQMQSLEKLNNKIVLSRYISATLHTLQKERGLSSGYLEDKENKFKEDLLNQRKESDFQINRLLKIKKISKKLSQKISNFENIRKRIDKREITPKEIIKYYTDMNAYLLELVVRISQSSHIPKITQNILAYVNFLYLKEYGGIERAEGVIILSQKELSRDSLIRFTDIISIQNQNESMFLKYASNKIKKFYKKKKELKPFKEVENIQNIIIYQNISKGDIDPKYWYELITQKLNILDDVGRYIEDTIKIRIQKELKTVRTIFDVVLFLTILSLFVFILMLVAFLKLAKEEQRLRVVTEKYIISSVTDLKGKILDASEAFCDISGYKKSELIGKPHNIVRHPDMPKEAFKDLWSTIQQGKPWRGKVKNLKKGGGFYWVWANIEPLYNAKGEIDSYISVRLDITESELLMQKIKEEEEKNKLAQDMMHQQSRLAQMGEMLSMIAHQWRQPLSAITAASGAINLKAKLNKLDTDAAVELSEKIMEFSQHLSSTIDDFRGFFKSNKTKSRVNFKKLLQDVVGIVKSSLENNNIDLTINVVSCDKILTYESELKQVLLNLIKNSEDALRDNAVENPTIMVEINNNVLTIQDNAGGIPEEIMDKIFDPYFSTKTKKDGTGLGLYMSKTIIEEHCQGKLSVSNEEFKNGQGMSMYGAKFKITLGENND
jgi:PAS domain S-box-containing protein